MSLSLPDCTRFWTRVTLPFYLLGLGWIVFAPAQEAERVTGVVAWVAEVLGRPGVQVDEAYLALEFLANIALFVPFGALLLLYFGRLRWWTTVAFGLVTSVAIELIQLSLPTRYSTLSDVIGNTLGAGVGVLIVKLLHGVRHRAEYGKRQETS